MSDPIARRNKAQQGHLLWYDLFHLRGTRRDFLRVGGSVASLVALGAMPACGRGRRIQVLSDPFTFGVASGDPLPRSVVLWTRLAPTALEGAGALLEAVAVDWEIAEDEAFTRVARTGSAVAPPELGHSVHVEVEGLEPGREYFYRMITGGEASPVGRTKTAPPSSAPLDEFRFAFASCQHYEQGLFTALRHLSNEDLDLIVHLGDYIYEGAPTPDRVRQHEGPEIMTLDDYRAGTRRIVRTPISKRPTPPRPGSSRRTITRSTMTTPPRSPRAGRRQRRSSCAGPPRTRPSTNSCRSAARRCRQGPTCCSIGDCASAISSR